MRTYVPKLRFGMQLQKRSYAKTPFLHALALYAVQKRSYTKTKLYKNEVMPKRSYAKTSFLHGVQSFALYVRITPFLYNFVFARNARTTSFWYVPALALHTKLNRE